MSNKKILVIGPLPPPMAGPEIVTKNIERSFELNQSFDLHILNTTVRNNNSEKGKIDLRLFVAYVLYVSRLSKALILVRPDLVFYLPTSATKIGWVRDGSTILIAILLRRKIAILMQGGHFRFFYDKSGIFLKKTLSFLLTKCQKIFVQAERLKFQFDGIIRNNNISVFYNFIDKEFLEKFENIDRDEKVFINVLFVGHLTSAKGYCDLLKVIPNIDNAIFTVIGAAGDTSNVRFHQSSKEVLVYENPDEIFKEHIIHNNLTNKVRFLGGTVSGDDKITAFQNADIFVSPSYSEGFSTAMLEAMAAGLPIIASNVGAAPEVLESGVNGYVISPGDIDELQNSLNNLVSNKDIRMAMGRRNRKLCTEKYSDVVVIKNLVKDLKSIC